MGGICSPTLQDRKQKPFSLRVVGMPWAAGNKDSIMGLPIKEIINYIEKLKK